MFAHRRTAIQPRARSRKAFDAPVAVYATHDNGPLQRFSKGVPRYYRPNTNLEEISDWLTKIIVGIGLVQIGRATSALGRFADAIGPALGDGPYSPAFGLTIVVFYAVLGFLVSYLWTQLSYRGQLHELEINLERERLGDLAAPPTIGAPKADDTASLTTSRLWSFRRKTSRSKRTAEACESLTAAP